MFFSWYGNNARVSQYDLGVVKTTAGGKNWELKATVYVKNLDLVVLLLIPRILRTGGIIN